ncbi:MAG: anti-sigma factor domain-containing protein [Chitinophagaceae bacterium]
MDIQAYIASGVVESYVLGLATNEERAELEQLLPQHPELQNALTNFEQSLENFHQTQAAVPPPAIKANLMAQLADEFATDTTSVATTTAPVVPLNHHNTATAKEQSMQLWRNIAAAMVALLVGSVALNVYYYNAASEAQQTVKSLISQNNSLQASINATQVRMQEMNNGFKLMADPNVLMVKLTAAANELKGNAATVFWDSRTKDVFVMNTALAPAPAGKEYQLWAIVDGVPVDAGMMGKCAEGICKMKNIQKAQAFAISLEDAGGNPTPKGTIYVLGKVG